MSDGAGAGSVIEPDTGRLRIKPWLRLRQNPDGTVLTRRGDRLVSLSGEAARKVLPLLLPLLDGARERAEIIECFVEPVRPTIAKMLDELDRRHLLDRRLMPSMDTDELFAAETREQLRSEPSTVVVAGTDRAAQLCLELLRSSSQFSVETTTDFRALPEYKADLAVLVGAGIQQLREWNSHALQQQASWLPIIGYDGSHAIVGPVYRPGVGPCFECYLIRRRSTSPLSLQAAAAWDDPAATDLLEPHASHPAGFDAVTAGLAQTTVLMHARGLDVGQSLANFAAIAIAEGLPELSYHRLLRVPRCPACSSVPRAGGPAPWSAPQVHERPR